MLTRISDIGLTDDELEDNICIKICCHRGVWKINKDEIKINISGIVSDHFSKRCKHFNGPQLFSRTCYHF